MMSFSHGGSKLQRTAQFDYGILCFVLLDKFLGTGIVLLRSQLRVGAAPRTPHESNAENTRDDTAGKKGHSSTPPQS